MINKYRHVKYTDDGCDIYECMVCNSRWESRYFPTNFCAGCGIKFSGLHECRSHDTPRWEYERYGNERLPSHIRDIESRIYKEQQSKVSWEIQVRSKWSGVEYEWGEWEYESRLNGKDCNHKLAKSWLDSCRRRHTYNSNEVEREIYDIKVEYRVVRGIELTCGIFFKPNQKQ